MTRRSALNVALLLAVVAAAAAVWLVRGRPVETPGGYELTTLQVADVRSIEIHRRGAAPIVLRRAGAEWTMEKPWPGRVSDVPVGRLLELARTRTDARFAADELARFELERPWARVVLNGHNLDFGATNTMTRELYVASGGYVHPIPARSGAAIPREPSELLDRRLFAPAEEPVAFDLRGLRVAHDGTRWTVDPAVADLSQDDAQRWIAQWRHASSVSTRPSSPLPATETVRVRLRSGGQIEIQVVARTPQLILRRIDEGRDYELPASLAEPLFAHPGAAPVREKS